MLTASNTLADADGLGAISYQWQRDGVNVAGATGATYTLGDADVGHTIDVVASYTDGHGTLESVASAATAAVTNVNDAPTGTVTISGTAQEDQVLTASNTLADADGLGAISYQWQRDGVNVAGATGATYTLGDADVGHTIDVVASYTDGHGTLESVASAATAAVTNVNDAPTGTVTISGTASRGPGADGVEHAGGCRRPWRDQLPVAARRGQRRRGDRRHLYAGRCRCRPHHRRGGELHRRPWHAGERGQRGDGGGHQCQRRPDRDGDDQRHRAGEPGADGVEHAGGCRRPWRDQLPVAARRGQRRRGHRRHLYAGRCRCRPHHRRGGELHRRPWHAGERGQRGDGGGHQCQRRPDRDGDDQRHRAGEPGADGVEHAGGCRRPWRDQLPVAARRGQRRRGHRRHLYAGRCRCRPHHRRGGELHRRPWHAGERGQRGDGGGHQCQRRPDRDGDDQRHRIQGPGADGVEHAGGCRRPWRDQLPVAARRGQRRRGHRRHLYAGRCRCRPHHRRGGELHRRPWHAGERGQRGDGGGHQCQRRPDRDGDDQRHRAGEPGADGVEHAGGCRRPWRDQLPVAARRGQRRRGHRRHLYAGRCRCRPHHRRGGELHRRPWHAGERGQRGDGGGHQCQRRPDRDGDDQRHRVRRTRC